VGGNGTILFNGGINIAKIAGLMYPAEIFGVNPPFVARYRFFGGHYVARARARADSPEISVTMQECNGGCKSH